MLTLRSFSSRSSLAAVWFAWLASVCWNWLVFRFSILHPPWQPLALLFAIQIVAAFWLAVISARRIWQRDRRRDAFGALLLGLSPLWLWAAIVSYVLSTSGEGYIPFNVLTAQGIGVGASIGDLEIRLRYPNRAEGERAVMFHRGWPASKDQVAAIDRHLANLERTLGRPSRGKAHWVRGQLWGRGNYYFQGLAMSDPNEPPPDSPDGLTTIDRHELAHFAIEQLCNHTHRPPFVLVEGWAESQSGYEPGHLARQAMHARECGASLSLAELTSNDWYCRDLGPVYTHGGALVEYLLRIYGGPRFFELYTTCRPETFAADVRRVLDIDLEKLDRDYWADVARQCPPFRDRLRRALEKLPLAEGADVEMYHAFAREFPTACESPEAIRDGVCEIRIINEVHDGEDPPRRDEQRVEVIRAGAQRGIINHNYWSAAEEVIVAGAEGSFHLHRKKDQELWSHVTETFPPLDRLRRLEEVFEGSRWQQGLIPFSDEDLTEIERGHWRVAECACTTRNGQPIVKVVLVRVKPRLGEANERRLRFIPEKGWLFDGSELVRMGPDCRPARQESRIFYGSPPGEPPVQVGAKTTSVEDATGKLLWTAERRVFRRDLDDGAMQKLRLSSYPVASGPRWAAASISPSVAITWAGAALSLLSGIAFKAWELVDRRRAGFP